MKIFSKLSKVFIAVMLIMAVTSSQAFAVGKAINSKDFTFTVDGKKIDLLKNSNVSIAKSLNLKWQEEELNEDSYLYIKNSQVKMNTWTISESTFMSSVLFLNNKVSTARGIKVGSTEKQLLAAYPKPYSKSTEGKYRIYEFQAPLPDDMSKDLDKMDDQYRINGARPAYSYVISATVDTKTLKITKIGFAFALAG